MILNHITLDLLKFKYINTKMKELILCVYDTKKFNEVVKTIVYNRVDEMKALVDKNGQLTIAKSMLHFLYKELKNCLEEEVHRYYNDVKNINDDIHNIKKNVMNIISNSINDVCKIPDPAYLYHGPEECAHFERNGYHNIGKRKMIHPQFSDDLNSLFQLYDQIYTDEINNNIKSDILKNYCIRNSTAITSNMPSNTDREGTLSVSYPHYSCSKHQNQYATIHSTMPTEIIHVPAYTSQAMHPCYNVYDGVSQFYEGRLHNANNIGTPDLMHNTSIPIYEKNKDNVASYHMGNRSMDRAGNRIQQKDQPVNYFTTNSQEYSNSSLNRIASIQSNLQATHNLNQQSNKSKSYSRFNRVDRSREQVTKNPLNKSMSGQRMQTTNLPNMKNSTDHPRPINIRNNMLMCLENKVGIQEDSIYRGPSLPNMTYTNSSMMYPMNYKNKEISKNGAMRGDYGNNPCYESCAFYSPSGKEILPHLNMTNGVLPQPVQVIKGSRNVHLKPQVIEVYKKNFVKITDRKEDMNIISEKEGTKHCPINHDRDENHHVTYSGFEIISSKEQIKELEKSLNDKWGSFKLFEKWIKDCSKWQWIDVKLQREHLHSKIQLEQLKHEKQMYIEKCINIKIKELWTGRMKGLMYMKLNDMERKVRENFTSTSSSTAHQKIYDVMLDFERKAMSYEDLFAYTLTKESYKKKLHLFKKYNEYKDKRRYDIEDMREYSELTTEYNKPVLSNDSKKKKGYVKSLINTFNRKSQKNSAPSNQVVHNKEDTKVNETDVKSSRMRNPYIKEEASSNENDNCEREVKYVQKENKYLDDYKYLRAMELQDKYGDSKTSNIKDTMSTVNINKGSKFECTKSLIPFEKGSISKENKMEKKVLHSSKDQNTSEIKNKSNIIVEEDAKSSKSTKQVDEKIPKEKKTKKSNISALKNFFNLKKKSKDLENEKSENKEPDEEQSNSVEKTWDREYKNDEAREFFVNSAKEEKYVVKKKRESNSSRIQNKYVDYLDYEIKEMSEEDNTKKQISLEKKEVYKKGDIPEDKKKIMHSKSLEPDWYKPNEASNRINMLHREKKIIQDKDSSKGNESSFMNLLSKHNNNEKGVHLKRTVKQKSRSSSNSSSSLSDGSHYPKDNKYSREGSAHPNRDKSFVGFELGSHHNKYPELLKKGANESNVETRKRQVHQGMSKLPLSVGEFSDDAMYNSKFNEDEKSDKESDMDNSSTGNKFCRLGTLKKKKKANKFNKFFKNLGYLGFKSNKSKSSKGNNYTQKIGVSSSSTMSKNFKRTGTKIKHYHHSHSNGKNHTVAFTKEQSCDHISPSDLSNHNSYSKKKITHKVNNIYSYLNKLKEKKRSSTSLREDTGELNNVDEHRKRKGSFFNDKIQRDQSGKLHWDAIQSEEEESVNRRKYLAELKYNSFNGENRISRKEKSTFSSRDNNYSKEKYEQIKQKKNSNESLKTKKGIVTEMNNSYKNQNGDTNTWKSKVLLNTFDSKKKSKQAGSFVLSPRFGHNTNAYNSELTKKKDDSKFQINSQGHDYKNTKYNNKLKGDSKISKVKNIDEVSNLSDAVESYMNSTSNGDKQNIIKNKKQNENIYTVDITGVTNEDGNNESSSNSHDIVKLSSFKSESNTQNSENKQLDIPYYENSSDEAKNAEYSYYEYVKSIVSFNILEPKITDASSESEDPSTFSDKNED